MRKFATLLIILIIFVLISLELILVNFRIGLLTPARVKSLAAESSLDEYLAAALREEVVKAQSESLDQNKTLEIANEAVSGPAVRQVINLSVDSFFEAISLSGNRVITVPFSYLDQRLKESVSKSIPGAETDSAFNINQDWSLNLGQSLWVKVAGYYDYIMVGLGLLILLMIVGLFFLASRKVAWRLFSVSTVFISVGLVLLAAFLYGKFQGDQIINYALPVASLDDTKLQVGFAKMIQLIIDQQIIIILAESVVLLLIGSVLIALGRSAWEINFDLVKPDKEVQS